MRVMTLRKWLYLVASSAWLLASTGCPDAEEIRDRAATSASSLVTGLIDSYVTTGVNSVLGV